MPHPPDPTASFDTPMRTLFVIATWCIGMVGRFASSRYMSVSKNPDATFRMTLFRMVTCSTTHHEHPVFWFTLQRTNASPCCPCGHEFSNTFPSMSTRRPVLSSTRFLTSQRDPFQLIGRVMWLREISISLGTLFP